ncbi:hypothetical protein B7486_38285 [cyanobacterium TDX16]|nr:hypothetical protein B7486_38285 [cyanobacterium TDX16]
MSHENQPSVKKLKQQYPSVEYELITGERLFQMLMESISKPRGIRAWEFQQKVKRKVEWLRINDPDFVEFYLANPY